MSLTNQIATTVLFGTALSGHTAFIPYVPASTETRVAAVAHVLNAPGSTPSAVTSREEQEYVATYRSGKVAALSFDEFIDHYETFVADGTVGVASVEAEPLQLDWDW